MTSATALAEDGAKILELQAGLASVIFSAGSDTVKWRAEKVLQEAWAQQELQDQYVTVLLSNGNHLQGAVLAAKLVS